MSSNVTYPDGGLAVDIPLPVGHQLVAYTHDRAQIQRVQGYTNQPERVSQIAEIIREQQRFGPFLTDTTLRINAHAAPVLWQVGTSPTITERRGLRAQPDPAELNATGALNAAAVLTGLVTSTTGAAVTGSLDSGSTFDASGVYDVNDSVDWSVINTGGNTFTVAPSPDHTLVGAATVSASTSGTFRTRKVSAGVFVTYRIT